MYFGRFAGYEVLLALGTGSGCNNISLLMADTV